MNLRHVFKAGRTVPRRSPLRASLAVFVVVIGNGVAAQSAGVYDLTWNTVDAGGGTSAAGIYALSGTIGQSDIPQSAPSTAGVYTFTPGFWPGVQAAGTPGDALFKDGFE